MSTINEELWEEYDTHYWEKRCCSGPCINWNDEEGYSGAREFFEWLMNRNKKKV